MSIASGRVKAAVLAALMVFTSVSMAVDMNTVDEILDYAIDQEQQAAAFYASLAERAEKAGMKEILLDFAAEEQSHKERLLAVKQGKHELTPEQEVLDLLDEDDATAG